MKKRCILSLTTSGHGYSGALSIDGNIVAASSLERITRKKYDLMLPISKADLETFGWDGDPKHYKELIDLPFDLENDYTQINFEKIDNFHLLINYLLEAGNISLNDIECVAYSYRHVESVKNYFKKIIPEAEFIVPEHHFAHACQAYLPSQFDDAAIMVVDGQGVPLERVGYDQLSGVLAHGKGNSIEVLEELPVSCSLGGMYSEITRLCGFQTNEEGKTMGLAPYGKPDYYDRIKESIRYNLKKYDIRNIKKRIRRGARPDEVLYSLGPYHKFLSQFTPRDRKEDFTQQHKDLAYLGQQIVEDVMIYLANWLYDKTGSKNLCISGGVGLNCVANYKVLEKCNFDNIFIYPNAGDNGLAVGQALYVHNLIDSNERKYITKDDYLGKSYSDIEIVNAVDQYKNKNGINIHGSSPN